MKPQLFVFDGVIPDGQSREKGRGRARERGSGRGKEREKERAPASMALREAMSTPTAPLVLSSFSG